MSARTMREQRFFDLLHHARELKRRKLDKLQRWIWIHGYLSGVYDGQAKARKILKEAIDEGKTR